MLSVSVCTHPTEEGDFLKGNSTIRKEIHTVCVGSVTSSQTTPNGESGQCSCKRGACV